MGRGTLAIFLFIYLSFLTESSAQPALESTLPLIIIDTENSSIPDEPKIMGRMGIINNGPGGVNRSTDSFNDYNGHIGIELRGSSSQDKFPKKGFGIELWNAQGDDINASILGLPAEEDWVLHGPYSDKTLIRNVLTFHLWSEMGRSGSRTRLVELIVNEEYLGVYVAMEKIKRGKNRVDISKLNADENTGDDLTGGYIVKIDKLTGSNSEVAWKSPFLPTESSTEEQIVNYQIEYPKTDEVTSAQKAYIQSYITNFEASLNSSEFRGENGYRKYINTASFIDFSIINEISKDIDGYRASTFLYKDKDSGDGKLTMGPIWDFNLGFGNSESCGYHSPEGWAWNFNRTCGGTGLMPFWWDRFLEDAAYVNDLQDRWFELREGPLSTDKVLNFIDSMALMLEEPALRNFDKWPVLGTYVWPNFFIGEEGTYQEEIDYLKAWTANRLSWMDDNLRIMEAFPITGGVPEIIRNPEVDIYPNPTQSIVNLWSPNRITDIQILSLSGQVKFEVNNLNSETISLDISALPSNIYFVLVTNLGGVIDSHRLIKID